MILCELVVFFWNQSLHYFHFSKTVTQSVFPPSQSSGKIELKTLVVFYQLLLPQTDFYFAYFLFDFSLHDYPIGRIPNQDVENVSVLLLCLENPEG